MKRLMLVAITILACASAAPAITVDGVVDAEYGAAVAVQDTPTGFGNNFSELNAAFAQLDASGNLALMLTGNLETNNNGLVIFLDSRAGGAIAGPVGAGYGVIGSVGGARTDDWGTDTDGGIGVGATPGGGSILDPGFNPDIAIEINAGDTNNPTSYYSNIIDLTVPNEPDDERDIFLGVNTFGAGSQVQIYDRPDNDITKGDGGTIEHAFNNSNTAGVSDIDASTALTATTGWEAILSSAFLANDGQPIRIVAFITNGDGSFLSNQFLGEAGLAGSSNLGGPGDPGGTPLFDAQVFPGNQFFTIATDDELSADYNNDGSVDAADYVLWRKTDAGNPAGYQAFVEQFGETSPGSGGAGGVPEPASMLLMLLAGVAISGFARRR